MDTPEFLSSDESISFTVTSLFAMLLANFFHSDFMSWQWPHHDAENRRTDLPLFGMSVDDFVISVPRSVRLAV